jgi:hypothetical protein
VRNKDQILLENLYSQILEDAESMYAWMDPSGQIVSNRGEGHFSAAKRILQTKYNTPIKDIMFANQAYDLLFVKGWMRLTYIGDILYCHNNKTRPNSRQIREMKNLAMENRMSRIYFDDEYGDDYKTIWTSTDI